MSQVSEDKPIVHYDEEADILYIVTREGEEEECVEIASGIAIELDENGDVIGIEIQGASKMLKMVPELLNAIRN